MNTKIKKALLFLVILLVCGLLGVYLFHLSLVNQRYTYYKCNSVNDSQLVYQGEDCGMDSCRSTFYSSEGRILEKTPDYGPGSANDTFIQKTQTKDCVEINRRTFNKAVRP